MRSRCSGRLILQTAGWIVLALWLIPLRNRHAISSQQSERDPRFGVIEAHDAPAFADNLGIGWSRARLHWGLIQPTGPDEWVEAELTTEELDQELAAGREVIGLLIGVPDWARDAKGLPRGLYLQVGDPGNTWAAFVRQAITMYGGRINHWIVWNEPDVWDPNHPGFTWPGDEADYVQLLKVAYLVAHQENPDAFVHLAAVTHWWDAQSNRELYFRRLMAALAAEPEAAANNYYHDAATVHLYFNPASIYEIIEMYEVIQADYGISKPLWLLETNAAPSSDPAWRVENPTFRVSLLEQAAYFPQTLALALAAGADRIGVYKLIDTEGDYAANPEPFGLVRADSAPRPAYKTFQVAIEQLSGLDQVTWIDRHLVAQVVAFKPGQITRILWSRVPMPQVADVPALSRSAVLIDMWGNQTPLSPLDGQYTITLLAGECQETVGDYCMIGGPPVYLVEQVSSEAALPLDTLTLQAEMLEGDVAVGQASQMRRNLIMWAAFGGCILLLAAGGLAARLRTGRF